MDHEAQFSVSLSSQELLFPQLGFKYTYNNDKNGMNRNQVNDYIISPDSIECPILLKCILEYEKEYDHVMHEFTPASLAWPAEYQGWSPGVLGRMKKGIGIPHRGKFPEVSQRPPHILC